MPNRLRINGEWVDILLTEPFKFVVASSKYLASRVAFIEEFGQKLPKEVVETAKAAGQRLPKDRQTDLFDRFVKGANKDHEARKFINEMTRAMNGLDITDPVIDATSEMARANRRILRPLTGLWSVLRLSGAPTVIVNVLEPFNTLATHVGWTPTLKGFHDVWGAYSKWHTGDGTEWRALLARARKAGVVFKEPPRLPEAPWDARKGDRWDSTLEWASFASMPQKVVNSLNELQAFRATEILRDTFSGKPAELAGLRMVDMPSDIAKRLQEGKGTEADWLHVIRTMPQWTQGTGRLTEQSRFQQNRYTRTWLKFLTFARNYARYNADFAKLGTKIASGKAEAGDVQVFGRYLAGKGVVGVPAYLLTQTLIHMANGLLLSDADDAGQITANFVEELRDYMIAQELAGPGLASVAKWITGQQSGNIASQAARVFAPTSIAYEAWEAATASGKYTNEHWSERAGMWAMSQVPILNQAKKFISAVSGEEQPEFRVARSRYYDYLNEIGEGPPADRSGYKEFTAIMRDFRDSFWKAGHDRGTVSRDDLRDILREAAGVSDKGWDSVAASLRSRKFLSALDKEQRDEFQSRIGTDQYQLLLDHDRAIDKWIEWANWRR